MQSAPQFGRRGVVATASAAKPAHRTPPTAEAPGAGRAGAFRLHAAAAGRPAVRFPEGRVQRGVYRLCRFTWYVVMLLVLYDGLNQALTQAKGNPVLLTVWGLVAVSFPVLIVWTTLAMQVKRWHDRDKSWPWLFVGFIPIVGPVWVLIECAFLEGTQGPNRFGPSPKGDPTAACWLKSPPEPPRSPAADAEKRNENIRCGATASPLGSMAMAETSNTPPGLDPVPETLQARLTAGYEAWRDRKPDALTMLQAALAEAEAQGQPIWRACAKHHLANLMFNFGRDEEFERLHAEVLEEGQALDLEPIVGTSLVGLAHVDVVQGRVWRRRGPRYQEALAISRCGASAGLRRDRAPDAALRGPARGGGPARRGVRASALGSVMDAGGTAAALPPCFAAWFERRRGWAAREHQLAMVEKAAAGRAATPC